MDRELSRRGFLSGTLALGGAGLLAACSSGSTSTARAATTSSPPTGGGGATRRLAGSRPDPSLPEGTDTLPQIEHIVVVMMENHSFDNVLGTSGRGDGFTMRRGVPTNTNPDGHGDLVHAFHMPTPCQLPHQPSQTWAASHQQYDGGTNQGFVVSQSGPVAMGYWTEVDLPFTASLARTFPIGDRYFCSVLAQTYPNRRYLTAATSLGLVSDTFATTLPPNGTIFDTLNRHGISWRNYYSNGPTVGIWLPLLSQPAIAANLAKFEQFLTDCAAGTLPGFCIVDPDFDHTSEENPQDIQAGENFLAQVVNAVMQGPAWPKTLLVWNYDEHGGYYDHVPPPPAVEPDDVAPVLGPGDPPGAFDRYGFRVPFGVVCPYARRDYVSRVVHDHTSILKLVETKWNLPALTARDANADDLLDSVDFESRPAFLDPPTLAAPADVALRAGCETTGPGTIPPPSAVTAA